MKKILFILVAILSFCSSIAQTNTFPSSGNVGIGTTSPSYLLDLHGSGATLNLNGTPWGNSGASLNLLGWAASYKNWKITTALFSTGLDFVPSTTIGGSSFSTPVMTILGNGRVGIGTINPAVPLELTGQFYLNRPSAMVDGGSTLGGGYINLVPSEFSNSNSSYISFSFPTSSIFKIGTDYDGHVGAGIYRDIVFGRANSGSNYLTIKDGGNVGIGTAAPSEKLSVNGNISTKKCIVTQTGWSDYVFNDDYKLRPLNQVEKFIKENKHLPDVPSVKEVEEEGIDLGANQAVLLKKIEELTLYMIDLKKENRQQQMEIQQLKKQIKIK